MRVQGPWFLARSSRKHDASLSTCCCLSGAQVVMCLVIMVSVECMMLDDPLSLSQSMRVSWTLARLWWWIRSCLRTSLSCVAMIAFPSESFGTNVLRNVKHSWCNSFQWSAVLVTPLISLRFCLMSGSRCRQRSCAMWILSRSLSQVSCELVVLKCLMCLSANCRRIN